MKNILFLPKFPFRLIYILLLVLVLFTINHEATANLLVNGDFENGSFTGWTWTSTANSAGTAGMIPSVSSFGIIFREPFSKCFQVSPGTDTYHSGMGLEEGGTLTQTINLVSGMQYSISLNAAMINPGPGELNDAGRIRVYINNILLWNWDINWIGSHVTVRNAYSGTYTAASSGQYTFKLLFTRTYMAYAPFVNHYADNISVTPIPEPASIFILGLGGIIGLKRSFT
ncbi:MAG: hypothetical protein BWY69_00510 [Planctomycetes bacterium ADurb.Bin401]|nr:MAG: hypothetical protein BWY69_00510 [Planctomycetes bacterium ADurb.Bin401]